MIGPNFVLIFLVVLFNFVSVVSGQSAQGCTFPKHVNPNMKNGEEQIKELVGKRFSTSDANYTYTIGICTTAVLNPDVAGISAEAGIIQTSKKDQKVKIIGKFTDADIVAGPDWVFLEYNGGEPYGSHCLGRDNTPENRRARIMFICDRASQETQPVVLEEQNNKTDACYYLFEFSTAHVCPPQPTITFGLSVGSVLLIVFVSVLAVYLIAGCAYSRFVLGAKGVQQIPNLEFWQDFGNLQADGCDLVCRTRKSREPRSYKGIGDDQLQEVEERTDDHLLPM